MSLKLFDFVEESRKLIEFLLSDASEDEKKLAIRNIKNLDKAHAVLMGIVLSQDDSVKIVPNISAISSWFMMNTEYLHAEKRRFPMYLYSEGDRGTTFLCEDAVRIKIYSKASFSPKNREGRYGIIADVYGEHGEYLHREKWSQGLYGTSKNKMELLGIIDALEQVLRDFGGEVKVEVICSSEYIVKALTQWVPVWKDNGWKKENGKPIQNAELFEWINNFQFPEVTFIYRKDEPLFEECLKISNI